MKAHIQQMPVAETGFLDGWNGDWEVEACKAYQHARGDFAVIAKGIHCIISAYWELGEFEAAHDAFLRISNALDDAQLEMAVERARLLSYNNNHDAPEQVFAAFIVARPRIQERLRNMTSDVGPALELTFSLEELME